jgi:hypothetical protein
METGGYTIQKGCPFSAFFEQPRTKGRAGKLRKVRSWDDQG